MCARSVFKESGFKRFLNTDNELDIGGSSVVRGTHPTIGVDSCFQIPRQRGLVDVLAIYELLNIMSGD